MKQIILSLILIQTAITSSAHAYDVHSTNGVLWINVEKDKTNKFVRFSKCIENDCQGIAGKKWFSIKKIQDQRFYEGAKTVNKTLANLLISAFVVGGGIEAGAAFGALAMTDSLLPLIGGGIAGGAAGTSVLVGTNKLIKDLNPIEQNKRRLAIRDEVILDQKVVVDSDEDVDHLASRLEEVLAHCE